MLQGLLREQVSVRNLVVILETMSDFAPITKNIELLTEKVRQALGRQICLQYADENHVLHILTVNPQLLQKMAENKAATVNGTVVAWEPASQRSWITAVNAAFAAVREKGYMPVILTSEEYRLLIKVSTEREMPDLVVLSVQEITNDIRVESLGEINV